MKGNTIVKQFIVAAIALVLMLSLASCGQGESAKETAQSEGCDVLLTEIDMGRSEQEGLDFARKMQTINPEVNIIFVTTFEESDFARDVIQMRASGFVRKPYKQQRLAEEFAHLRYAAT